MMPLMVQVVVASSGFSLAKFAFGVIPQDPARTECRHGITLEDDYKHWFRAKFFQQYRLFFLYHAATKVIFYAWVNDADTKRAYESGDDAYWIFRKMLESGQPPDDWDRLLAEVRAESDRLQKLVAQTTAAKP
jgi:toxin YhaV